jgi:hypothetical protein
MLENLLPFGGIIVSTEIRLELSRKDLERGGLSNTVRSDQTKNLTRSRGR